MSAIWGIVALDTQSKIPENCKNIFEQSYKTTCKLDRYESYSSTNAYIGCGIQFITKEAEAEILPIIDYNKNIVFASDCILDNRNEIIHLLSNHHYTEEQLLSSSDGALMYMMYSLYGADCVQYFRGLFSIAVWEYKSHSLTLISDHLAARCLYYIRKNNLIAFSTLLEPLLKIFPDTEPNLDYYKDFLLSPTSSVYMVPGETPYQNIHLMLPASSMKISTNGVHKKIYWELTYKTQALTGSPKEYETEFMNIYHSCVNDALRTTGEVGIAMSSGLDSSSVGVLAAQKLSTEQKTLYAYTFTPYNKTIKDARAHTISDESALVSEIAGMYPNINTTFLNNEGKNFFDDYGICSNLLEMPYKTGAVSNHYEICRESAKAGCKILLNGGYGNKTVSFGNIQHILYQLYLNKEYQKLFLWTYHYAKHMKFNYPKLMYRALKGFHHAKKQPNPSWESFRPANFYLKKSILENYDLQTRFSNDIHSTANGYYMDQRNHHAQLTSPQLLIYLGVFETKFGLNTGLLLRDPTKDIRMLTFCCQLPYTMFACEGIPRWLIRNGFNGLLPDSIIHNWGGHGLLNIDWVSRIQRDWKHIKPNILNTLSAANAYPVSQHICTEHLLKDIESFGTDSITDNKTIVHICAIYNLLYFLQARKSD